MATERRRQQPVHSAATSDEPTVPSRPSPPAHAKSLTLLYDELDPWQKDNFFIQTGYRRLQYSYLGCIRSLGYIHNETGNVFSHLLGALIFIASFFFTFSYVLGEAKLLWGDIIFISIFLCSAITCLGLSAFFHLVVCHSQHVCRIWNKADYAGIVILICGSTYPSIYYGLQCYPTERIIYLVGITVFGAGTMYTSLSNHFATPEYRIIRTSNFVALGLSAIIPVAHIMHLQGFTHTNSAVSFWYLIAMAACYLIGAFIYASRVPERWYPGSFDIWGHSHQIFHVLVVSAAIFHYFGLIRACKFWRETSPTCPLSG
ncbi:hemolysin-III related-domain-containing protein [Fimicolochytrium jonesii]|uniref:hemolysin-III related-domain-containing protein n=1 Tax=Fimicolochytrium jonesii TaxID=1396493 RepID=UPI0022FEF82A|nr:hemolysin-III related-domain-containing protein [Fimicolochytrium jonesii]KAI8820515.1 hemolysin-III related-domain-containing protein [Fimicolochytrium jonesii]